MTINYSESETGFGPRQGLLATYLFVEATAAENDKVTVSGLWIASPQQ